MAPELITSARNAKVQHVQHLMTSRKARNKHAEFFVEGVQAVSAAFRNNWEIANLIYCPDTVRSDWARGLIDSANPDVLMPVNSYVLGRLSSKDTPSELLAVVKKKEVTLDDVLVTGTSLILLLDRPHNPGNLGSTLRSAVAFGVQALLISGHSVDSFDPAVVRASIGCLFEIPVVYVPEPEILQSWLDAGRQSSPDLQVVSTSAQAATLIYDHPMTGPTVLVIGNEKLGISQHYQDISDAVVSIPMVGLPGAPNSLNASTAASILLYEVQRQRAIRST